MADVIAKLKVDAKEYDAGLSKATKRLNEFTKQNTSLNGIMSQGITTLTKFAGGFAAAELAVRGFNKIILEGSQVTGDFVRNGVGALNDTIGVLASSIATFDWSPFENGLMGVYQSALNLRRELDNLWNEQVARGTLSSRGQYQMTHARNVLTDPNATAEQRAQAQKDLDSAIEDLQAANTTFVKHLQDVIAQEGEFGTIAKNLTSRNVENIYEAVAKNGYEATVNAYKPIYNTLMEMRKNLNALEDEDIPFRGTPEEGADSGAHKQERENLKQMITDYEALYNEEIAGYKLLDKSDEQYQKISEHINQQYAVMSEIESLQRKSNINAKKMASLNGGGGTGRTGATAATEPITSSITELGDFKDFEKRLRDAFETATPSMNTLNQLAKDFKDDMLAATTPEQYENAARGMENVERFIAMQPLALKGGVTIDEAATEESLQQQFDDMRLQMKVDVEMNNESLAQAADSGKDAQKDWQAAARAISSAGSAMQGMDDKGLNVAGTIMEAIANVALAFSAALKSPATTAAGIFGWIAAAAAGTATMVATIASIKSATSGSYAQGGIVPGAYNGGLDNTYVYASPGEVILNRAQQENLLSQLEPATVGGGIIYAKGEQLITVINNTGRRTGRGEILFG